MRVIEISYHLNFWTRRVSVSSVEREKMVRNSIFFLRAMNVRICGQQRRKVEQVPDIIEATFLTCGIKREVEIV